MTDNPRESLNLVERMAKRMAAEAAQGVSAQPVTPSFAERVAQKVAASSPPATPAGQGAAAKNSQGPAQSLPENAAVAAAPAPPKPVDRQCRRRPREFRGQAGPISISGPCARTA